MTWEYTTYAAVFHFTALISVGTILLLVRRRGTPGTNALILLMLAVTEWSFAAGMEAASVDFSQKILWSKIEYLGAVSAPTLFMIFTLEYCQITRFLTRRFLLIYSVIPVVAVIATFTNDWHGLIWNSFTLSQTEPNSLIYGHGVGYYLLIAYDYAIVLLGLAVMVRAWFQLKQPYRRQIGIILFSSIFPVASGIAYSFGLNIIPGLDITPISFLLTGLIIALGVIQFGLFDLAPISRHLIIENMDDGILVLDDKNRIVDINPMAESIIAAPASSLLGHPISEVLASWGSFLQLIEQDNDPKIEILSRENPARYYNLRIQPLHNRNNDPLGRLFAFRDVTSYRQTEDKLARQNEELKIIERINLAITAGLDIQQTIKTLHQQCSHVAPIDLFYVALYDEDHALITVPLHYEHGHYQTGTLRDINERPGTIGDVIRTRKTLYLNDNINPVTGPLNPSVVTEKRGKSYIGIPLMVRDKVVGVISIQNYRANAYRQEQINMLERISLHAAIAIENAKLYSEVQRLAIIDELTGIYNYRGLKELGSREVERARRFSHPLSLLFFDIDDFRNFNNKYSHATGNIILQTLVQRCRTVLRSVDVFTRFGGDEFVALLPETDLSSAEAVAKRLVNEIAETKIPTPYGELHVTVSIGLAMLNNNTVDLDELVDRANRAEHQAKRGQNSIVAIAE
ncbi:MAG TPA: histidine kinase N-terminal 7TM domain-containing protein [Anaerolineales bacterium]|nr:histidine kinase N-terminal 7TM domain-containing protein [Anaerolineales bacterium]